MIRIDLSKLNKVSRTLLKYGLIPWGIGCGAVGVIMGLKNFVQVMLYDELYGNK